MSYEPTVWKAGDVVTSAKLNKLENAVADTGALIVNATFVNPEGGNEREFNKTFAEIKTAFLDGQQVVVFFDNSRDEQPNDYRCVDAIRENTATTYYAVCFSDMTEYVTDTVDGYPSYNPD